jgi:nucleotide-binding universal stress UspA family protein
VEKEPGPLEGVPEVEYADVLVPGTGSPISGEMIATAAKLAPGAENGSPVVYALYVVEVSWNRPVDAVTQAESEQAQSALDEARRIGEEYGVEVEGYTTGARNAGQAIVEEAERLEVEAVILGASRKRRLGRRVVSRNADYGLENTPCRVIVVEEAKAAR